MDTNNGYDWDLEAMAQTGTLGSKDIQAWGGGSRLGYTWQSIPWAPRLGLQLDVASGDRHRGDGKLGTFNPLFPNGYYFSLAGYTGYSNLIHVKPSNRSRAFRSDCCWLAVASDDRRCGVYAAQPAGRRNGWSRRTVDGLLRPT